MHIKCFSRSVDCRTLFSSSLSPLDSSPSFSSSTDYSSPSISTLNMYIKFISRYRTPPPLPPPPPPTPAPLSTPLPPTTTITTLPAHPTLLVTLDAASQRARGPVWSSCRSKRGRSGLRRAATGRFRGSGDVKPSKILPFADDTDGRRSAQCCSSSHELHGTRAAAGMR